MQEIGSLFAQFWHIFEELDVPVLNIKFSVLYLGIFAVSFSLLILRPILGVGGTFANGVAGIGKSARSSIRRSIDKTSPRKPVEVHHYHHKGSK